MFGWKIEIFCEIAEKSKFVGNLPREIDFVVKLPEKIEICFGNFPRNCLRNRNSSKFALKN